MSNSFRLAARRLSRARVSRPLTVQTLERRETPALFTVSVLDDSGPGSLRQALLDSAANAEDDTITITATGTLTTTDQLVYNSASGKNLTVNGPGAANLTVANGKAASSTSRVFNFADTFAGGKITVALSGLTVTGGNLNSGNGAGILITEEVLSLTNVVVTNNVNTSGDGGGIFSSSMTTLKGQIIGDGLVVSNNKATASGSQGGGIFINSAGTLTLTNSTVSGNESGEDGGGIYFFSAGAFTIDRSTVSGNKSGTAGVGVGGGGMYFFGTINADSSITNSTFSGNTAFKADGGGLVLRSLTSTTTNLVIRNSTFTANAAPAGNGGGIARGTGTGAFTLSSTIVAGNTAGTAADISFNAATTIPGNTNLIGVADAGNGTFTGTGHQTGTAAAPLNPVLAPLGNYGGPTLTHALAATFSPAFDAGNNDFALATDQRGLARTVGGGTDIGAVEGLSPIPSANFTKFGPVVTAGTTPDTLVVTYVDDVAISAASIGTDDITILSPAATPLTILSAAKSPETDSNKIEVTYKFAIPGGAWDISDNGTYSVSVNAGQVLDTAANAVPAGPIGGFDVGIAGVIVVDATNDEATDTDGKTSLREAILLANKNAVSLDTITFDAAVFGTPQTITLNGTEIAVNGPVTIVGPGANRVAVSGNVLSRIFNTTAAPAKAAITVSGLSLTQGKGVGSGGAVLIGDESVTFESVVIGDTTASGTGGAIAVSTSGGSLTVSKSTLSNNKSASSGGAIVATGAGTTLTIIDSTLAGNTGTTGGAVFSSATGPVTVSGSTFSGNTGTTSGGAFYLSSSNITMTNSTVSGNKVNTTSTGGGGLNVVGTNTVTIRNSTIVFNTATGGGTANGGGIRRTSAAGTWVISSTIVAKNTASSGGPDINVTVTGSSIAGNNNLIGIANKGNLNFTGTGNLTGTDTAPVDPNLKALANNGGPTQTHLPEIISPVFNNGNNDAALAFDQRGTGFNRVLQGAADIGATESISPLPSAKFGGLGPVVIPGPTPDTFTVTYSDDNAIDVSTIGTGDVKVFGPRNYADTPVLVSVDLNTNGTPRVATYQLTVPGGSWDALDSGKYSVQMQPDEVFDTDGTPLAVLPGEIGSFNVAIAGVIVVDATNDEATDTDGKVSLREALAVSNAAPGTPDTITFDPAVFGSAQTITLALNNLLIADKVQINGPGKDLLTVNANGNDTFAARAFFVQVPAADEVAIRGMTITGGNLKAGPFSGGGIAVSTGKLLVEQATITGNVVNRSGGGIYLYGGSPLTLRDSVVSNNSAVGPAAVPGGDAGGIGANTASPIVIERSTISGNFANDDGGGIYFFSGGTLNLIDSTVSGNTANGDDGGGIYAFGATVTVTNSTISGNTAGNDGGGVAMFSFGVLNLRNSTVTSNTAPVAGGVSLVGTANTIVSSIVAGNSGVNVQGTATVTSSVTAGDPRLAPLADNGGPTQTHALLPGSPARDAGSNDFFLDNDQRGPGFPRTIGGTTDAGSFEALANLPPTIAGPFYVFVNEGATALFQVTGSDPDGGAVNFGLAAGSPSWASIDSTTGVVTLMPTDGPTDSTILTVEVFDLDGGSASKDVNIVVRNVNPAIAPIGSFKLDANTPFSFSGNFTDPGADTHVGDVDYGDGSGWQPLVITGNTFDLNRTYVRAGNFTGRVRIADDDMAAGTYTYANFGVTVTGLLTGIDIDDGTNNPAGDYPNQASVIKRITLDFDGVVNVPAGKSSYTNTDLKSVAGSTIASLTRADGKTFTVNVLHTVMPGNDSRLVLTFSGGSGAATVQGGSLADGAYTLTIFGENFNVNDGVPFGPRVETFSRFFGDGNGDGQVNALDQAMFLAAYRTAAGNPNYRAYFDYDGDGFIGAADYFQFQTRMGKMAP